MNSSFSTALPTLQLAWDSTSIGLLKECPRKYYYSMLAAGNAGFVPRQESVHLTFGILYHGALERYDHARCAGRSHEQATIDAVRWTLVATWDKAKGRPWISDDTNKNRLTLVRSVVWYLDQFGENDPIKTIVLANGKPAVELSFRMDLGLAAPTGEQYIACGHLDRVGLFQEQTWIVDRKTTKSTISNEFFDKFSPDNQFSMYSTAGKIVFGLPISGLIVDAAQIAVTFTRFLRGFVQRTGAQLDEWYRDLRHYIQLAEYYAKSNYWPMNDKSCGNYGGCPYRQLCGKDPGVREMWMKAGFVQRIWDPLRSRGDI